MKKMFSLFVVVLLLASLGQVVSDIYLPSLPFIAKSFAVSQHLVQLSLFAFLSGLAFSQLLYGPVSDAYGRRYPLIVGLVLCGVGSIICWQSSSIAMFNLGRLVQGIGAGASMALSRSVMRDLFSGHALAKVGSYLSVANIAVMTSAPFIGGYIQHWLHWRASFVVLTAYCLLILLLLLFKLPETNQHRHKDHLKWQSIKSHVGYLFRGRVFIPYAVIIFCAYAAIVAWLTSGSLLLQQEYALSPQGFGGLCLIVGCIYGLGSLSNARLLNHFSAQQLLAVGLFIFFLGGVLISVVALLVQPNVMTVFIPVLVMLFGASIIFPNAYACLMTPFAKAAGIAGALASFLQILGGVVTSCLIAYLPNHNALPLGGVVILTALIALIAFRCRRMKTD